MDISFLELDLGIVETVKGTGFFLAELPTAFDPGSFVAENLVIHEMNPRKRIFFSARNEYNGSAMSFFIQLPEGVESGVARVYEVSGDTHDKSKAVIHFFSRHLGLLTSHTGNIEVNFSLVEKRVKGKFYFVIDTGELFKGDFDVTA
jgi:hypothetical protein